jgi:ACR3 family arsenite transporter
VQAGSPLALPTEDSGFRVLIPWWASLRRTMIAGRIRKEPMATTETTDRAVLGRLSRLDRLLPVWIGLAMALGLVLGAVIPDLNDWLDAVKIGSVSLPIAIGLLAMMYPVLAKVRYSQVGEITTDRRLMVSSLVLNWIVGPMLMFILAWLMLPDLPEYRTGLIIIGLARCIAMVLIWNDLACGDREAAAVLVAINSVFQIVAYSLLGYFYLELLPGWLGLDTASLDVSMWDIARIVLVFLGIPLIAGYLTRLWGERSRGIEWYESSFLPRIAPWALYGLLFTVVILFALQGETITAQPLDVARIALPLLAYFGLMWTFSFALGLRLRMSYEKNTAMSFTAASNNFELAIAVAIGVFGVTSGEALAGVVGPLIEVPVLVGLVYVALWARRRYYPDAREMP